MKKTTEPTSARASRHSASFHGAFTLVLAALIVLMVNYVGFKYYKHIDLSVAHFYSLSPKTKDVLAKLDSPVTVTTLISPQYEEQINNLLEEYQQVAGKNLVVEKIDPAYDIARAADLQKRLHFQATDFIIIFEYKGRSHFIKENDLFETDPMTGQVASFKGEQQFTSAIVGLAEGKASKVYFTEGHGEHSIQDMNEQGYGALGATLKEDNIDPANLNLAATGGEVPNDADAVVIAGPLTAFSAMEIGALQKYLSNNGKLLVLVDPYVNSGLDDLLKGYGLKFDDDLVLYRSGNAVTANGSVATFPLALIYEGGFSTTHPITTKFAQSHVQMQIIGARSLTINSDGQGQPNPKVQFLLQTDADAWGWVNKTPASTEDFSSYQDRTFDKATDIPGPIIVSAVYDDGPVANPGAKATVTGTRIIAIGASKFLENDIVMAKGEADTIGSNFFNNCLDWLVKKDATLDIAPKIPQDYGVNLSPMSSRTLAWVCEFFIPLAALALGIFTWFSPSQIKRLPAMLRNSTTYIYLAVTLGLLCYLTFIDKKIPGTEEQEKADTELYKFESQDVTGLEITNVRGTFIFEKNNDHWELKSPVDTPADDATVSEVITQIANAQPQRVITVDPIKDADNLKEWGFSPFAERVVIHTQDKKSYELLVGRKTALNDSVYTRASGRKGEPVRILPIQVKDVLDKELSDFRSRNVFDFDVDKVIRLSSQLANTATTPAQEYEIDLHDASWTLQKPLVARADSTDVQNLLNKILGLRAIDFITDDASNLSSYGLTSPSATLSVSVKPGDEIVLQIGGPVPGKTDQVYAQRLKSNSVFTVAKSGIDDLFRAIPNVRDLHILPLDPAKATGIAFSFGAKKGEARSKDHLWQTVGDSAGRADVGKITDIFARLSQLQTTPVLKDSATDLKPFGLDKPQGKITVQSPEFKPEASLTLLIGKDENKLLYVRNSIEPFIYTVPDNSFDFLPANNLELRDARAISVNLAKIKSMTITTGAQTPVILTRSSGGTWSPANVKDRMVDSLRADTEASLFSQLQAKAWLGPVKPAYGLDKPVLTISVQTDQPDPTVLRIGLPLPDGTHPAMVNGETVVFAITEGDFDILNTSTLRPIPAVLSPTNAAPAAPAKK